MPYANISYELDKEVAEQVLAKTAEIEKLLPFLIGLNKDERKALPKMAGKTRFFTSDALQAAEQNPELCPRYMDLEEMERDLALFDALSRISQPLRLLSRKLEDTTMAVGSEAYTVALAFYNTSKRAAKDGVPGAEEVAARLKVRFEQTKAKDDSADKAAGK
jgi:hypothetical protein